jgi:hypothetical protein
VHASSTDDGIHVANSLYLDLCDGGDRDAYPLAPNLLDSFSNDLILAFSMRGSFSSKWGFPPDRTVLLDIVFVLD